MNKPSNKSPPSDILNKLQVQMNNKTLLVFSCFIVTLFAQSISSPVMFQSTEHATNDYCEGTLCGNYKAKGNWCCPYKNAHVCSILLLTAYSVAY